MSLKYNHLFERNIIVKTGLVLEGGAMRGMFTAGVLDIFMENGIEFDGAVGVSAGAAFGCSYKSRQIGRSIRYNIRFCRDKRYCSVRSLLTTGDMYGAQFCYHDIPEKYDIFDIEAYKKNPMEFYVVCTDVVTGKAFYKKCDSFEGENIEYMRASASMPLVSRIVEVHGKKLLDGGIADSVPLKFFEGAGYDKNVVILTREKGYIKGKNSLMPIVKRVFAKYPDFIRTMQERHEVYNDTLKYIREKEARGELIVICPSKALELKRSEHDAVKLMGAYYEGRNEAVKRLSEIKDFLGQ